MCVCALTRNRTEGERLSFSEDQTGTDRAGHDHTYVSFPPEAASPAFEPPPRGPYKKRESGKLGAVIAQSLKQNAKAKLEVQSAPNEGLRVEIFFAREAAEPEAA